MSYETEILAPSVWGPHPISWPVPPRKRPCWWQFSARKNLAALEYVLGELPNEALARFWRERAEGQSVYEDAGGYLLRCYSAMLGEETQEPYTYDQAVSDLMDGREL